MSKARVLSNLSAQLTGPSGTVPSSNFALADSGVTPGSYGSASQVPILAIDSKGRVTSASTTSVAGVSSFGYSTTTGRLTINTADGGSYTADVTLAPFSTTNLVEGSNLYYTDARARNAVSATGSLSYNTSTGVFSFTQGNTDTVAEGITNLYYTDVRTRAAISYTSGSASYNSTNGVITIPTTTSHITESGNLYYTDARVRAAISATGSLSYNSTTGVFSFTQGNTDTVSEGTTNLYYTTTRANSDFDTRLATKSTSNLAEGTNLYYTDARVGSYLTSNAYATQTYVNTQVSNLVAAAPTTLDTLNELAAALGNDPSFATTVSTNLGTKALKATLINAGTGLTGGGDLSGDRTLSIANSGVVAGSYGSSTAIPVIAVNAQGQITSASTSSITVGGGTLGLSIGTAGATNSTVTIGTGSGFNANTSSNYTYDIKVGPALTNLATLMTTAGAGFIKRGATADTYTIDTNTYLTGNQTITLSGDVTGSGTTSITTTLAASGVTAGSGYNTFTVDSKGRVTSASTTSYLTSYTETDTLATVTGRGASTSTATTFNNTITVNGGNGLRVFQNGASTITSHLYFANATNTIAYNWQLDENNNSALWGYGGSTWTKLLSVASAGFLAVTGDASISARLKFTSANAFTGSQYAIIGLAPTGAVAGTYNHFGVYDYTNGRSMLEVYGDTRNVKVFGNVTTDGSLVTSLTSGTMFSHGSMTDALGWNASYGTYIGSTVGGTKYLYANGSFYDGSTNRALLHAGNYNSYSPTLTGGNASGTWSINITGNANSLGGYTQDFQTVVGTGDYLIVRNQASSKLSLASAASVASIAQSGASGTWGISISGSAAQLGGLTKIQLWNNSGNNHSTYQTFGAIPDFGLWFMQNSTAADTPQSASQYYVQTQGLGNDYAYSSYALMTAVARDHATKYTYYRTREGGTWGSWTKAAAGYADSAGSVSGGLTTSNYNSYSPTLTGGGASGTWGISVTGSSGSTTFATYVLCPDGDRLSYTKYPNSNGQRVRFDFVGAGQANGVGNYGGVMTYSPYDGTSASTGDSSYQLGFGNDSGLNASGMPRLSIRNGINTTWNSWYILLHAGNYTSYSPTLTGGGASGTWNINISGTAVGVNSSTGYVYRSGVDTAPAVIINSDGTYYGQIARRTTQSWGLGHGAGIGQATTFDFYYDTSGNVTATGNVTAYSDERLKTNWRDMPVDYIYDLAKVKVGVYDRIDGAKITQVGVSAQSLQKILPEAIVTSNDEINTLTVNYGGAALASAVELAKKVVEQEARIAKLEALVEMLINKVGE